MSSEAQKLIDVAEQKAADAMDPEKFDFLAALEDNGIEMPTETVKVFTNAKVHTKIQDLYAQQKALEKQQAELDTKATDAARAVRLAELIADAEALKVRNKDAQAEWDNDEGLVSEEPVLETVPTYVELQQKSVEEVPDVHTEPSDRIHEIQVEIDSLIKVAYADRLEITLQGLQPKESQTLTGEIEDELARPKQANAKLTPEQETEYTNERHANELLARSVITVHNPKTGTTTDFSKTRMPAAAARRILKILPVSETQKLLVTAQTLTYAAVLIDLKTDAGFLGGRSEPEGESVLDALYQDGEELG